VDDAIEQPDAFELQAQRRAVAGAVEDEFAEAPVGNQVVAIGAVVTE
jgi:hypothetical protein